MPTQYVFPSNAGLFRIVQHGHRWRALHDRQEVGRYGSAESALAALRDAWPHGRLPLSLDAWRRPETQPFRTPLPRWCNVAAY